MSDLLEYKCPCCGGAIEFNSTLQKMKCPYCDTEFDMETVKEFNEAAANQQSDELNWESASDNSWKEDEASGMSVYICQSCGGEIVADESTGASSCPFCGNPVVMSGKFSGTLRPDFIIPFKLDKKAAKEGLVKHLHGKSFYPKYLKRKITLTRSKVFMCLSGFLTPTLLQISAIMPPRPVSGVTATMIIRKPAITLFSVLETSGSTRFR